MQKTQQREDLRRMVNEAMLTAVMPDELPATLSVGKKESKAKTDRKAAVASPRNGQPVPQSQGRPVGVKNRLTNLRDAVLEAFDLVGGTQYLAKLAEGTSSDRAAFVGLVAKVLPTQINANVEGGIQVQLSWLGSRQIGTTAAQTVEEVTQVVDLERDSAGKYRIVDPKGTPEGGGQGSEAKAPEAAGGANDA